MKKNLELLLCIIFLSCNTVFSQGLIIQATQSSICAGDSVTLYAIGGRSQAVWRPGGIDSHSITVFPTVTTTYTVISGPYTVSYTVTVCENTKCINTKGPFIPLLLNTGNNGMNDMQYLGEQDLNWTYSRSMNGTYLPTIVSDNFSIPPNYSKTQWPNAQWIGPNSTLTSPGSGAYFFRVQFNLTAEEANSLVLNMQFMADNTVIAVHVNNVLVPKSGTPRGSIYGFQAANVSTVTMQGNWIEGLNTLTVEINDLGSYVGFVAQLNPRIVLTNPDVICGERVYVTRDTLEVCKHDSVQLEAQYAVSYSWSPITGLSDPSIAKPKAAPLVSTTYVVSGSDSNGHLTYDSVFVLVHNVPSFEFEISETTLCSDQSMQLDVSIPNTSVLWQDGSTNPRYTVRHPGVYYVEVTNQCGTVSDTLNVLACCEIIHVPNLFTPNNDRHNDFFNIGCLGTGSWELKVYNRWGDQVYSNSNYQNNWNGNNVSDGVYYYHLSKINKPEYIGWVQIVR